MENLEKSNDVNYCQVVEDLQIDNKVKNDELEKIPLADELLPLLMEEGIRKGLKVFVFDNEELKKFGTPKYDNIGVALLAKNEDSAIWNIRNLRKCYIIK